MIGTSAGRANNHSCRNLLGKIETLMKKKEYKEISNSNKDKNGERSYNMKAYKGKNNGSMSRVTYQIDDEKTKEKTEKNQELDYKKVTMMHILDEQTTNETKYENYQNATDSNYMETNGEWETIAKKEKKKTYVRWTLTHLNNDKNNQNKPIAQTEDKGKSNKKPLPKKSTTDSQKQKGKLSNIEKYHIGKRTTERAIIKYINPQTTSEEKDELLLTQDNYDTQIESKYNHNIEKMYITKNRSNKKENSTIKIVQTKKERKGCSDIKNKNKTTSEIINENKKYETNFKEMTVHPLVKNKENTNQQQIKDYYNTRKARKNEKNGNQQNETYTDTKHQSSIQYENTNKNKASRASEKENKYMKLLNKWDGKHTRSNIRINKNLNWPDTTIADYESQENSKLDEIINNAANDIKMDMEKQHSKYSVANAKENTTLNTSLPDISLNSLETSASTDNPMEQIFDDSYDISNNESTSKKTTIPKEKHGQPQSITNIVTESENILEEKQKLISEMNKWTSKYDTSVDMDDMPDLYESENEQTSRNENLIQDTKHQTYISGRRKLSSLAAAQAEITHHFKTKPVESKTIISSTKTLVMDGKQRLLDAINKWTSTFDNTNETENQATLYNNDKKIKNPNKLGDSYEKNTTNNKDDENMAEEKTETNAASGFTQQKNKPNVLYNANAVTKTTNTTKTINQNVNSTESASIEEKTTFPNNELKYESNILQNEDTSRGIPTIVGGKQNITSKTIISNKTNNNKTTKNTCIKSPALATNASAWMIVVNTTTMKHEFEIRKILIGLMESLQRADPKITLTNLPNTEEISNSLKIGDEIPNEKSKLQKYVDNPRINSNGKLIFRLYLSSETDVEETIYGHIHKKWMETNKTRMFSSKLTTSKPSFVGFYDEPNPEKKHINFLEIRIAKHINNPSIEFQVVIRPIFVEGRGNSTPVFMILSDNTNTKQIREILNKVHNNMHMFYSWEKYTDLSKLQKLHVIQEMQLNNKLFKSVLLHGFKDEIDIGNYKVNDKNRSDAISLSGESENSRMEDLQHMDLSETRIETDDSWDHEYEQNQIEKNIQETEEIYIFVCNKYKLMDQSPLIKGIIGPTNGIIQVWYLTKQQNETESLMEVLITEIARNMTDQCISKTFQNVEAIYTSINQIEEWKPNDLIKTIPPATPYKQNYQSNWNNKGESKFCMTNDKIENTETEQHNKNREWNKIKNVSAIYQQQSPELIISPTNQTTTRIISTNRPQTTNPDRKEEIENMIQSYCNKILLNANADIKSEIKTITSKLSDYKENNKKEISKIENSLERIEKENKDTINKNKEENKNSMDIIIKNQDTMMSFLAKLTNIPPNKTSYTDEERDPGNQQFIGGISMTENQHPNANYIRKTSLWTATPSEFTKSRGINDNPTAKQQ